MATTDLVLTCVRGDNADLFPQVLQLHVPPGSVVADTTYGQGVFWRQVPEGLYTLLATDLQNDGVDARSLPYLDHSVDAVIFDPPYMHGDGGIYQTGLQAFGAYYRVNERPPADEGAPKWHDAVMALYYEAAREARRVLKPRGKLILKCQDTVCAGKQRWTHMELHARLGSPEYGFTLVDLFVLMREGSPGVSRLLKQRHARRNHSYFLIFEAPRSTSSR